MKKIYSLLAMVMMFFAFAGNAQAIWWTSDGNGGITEPEEGVAYAIVFGQGGVDDHAYLKADGNWNTSYGTTENVWYFEKAEGGWHIYCIVDGKKQYIANAANASRGFTCGAEYASRIGVFAIEAAVLSESGDFDDAGNTTFEANDNQVVIYDVTTKVTDDEGIHEASFLAASGTSAKVSYSTDIDNNVLYITAFGEMDEATYAESVLAYYFPDGFDADSYDIGISPGQYNEEAVMALAQAYENCNDQFTAEAADALIAAYKDFQENGFVNFGEGYYIFTTYRSDKGALFDNTGNVAGMTANYYTITNPAVAITHTQNGTEYSCGAWDVYDPEDDEAWMKTAAASYFIWKVIASDVPGMYYVQNWKTGRYIGTPGADKASNTPIPMVDTPNAKFNMEPSANYPGYWKFYSDELTKKAAWAAGGTWAMGGLHAPGDVLNMVTWNYETDGSLWLPRAIEESMLEEIKALGEQPQLNSDLQILVNKAYDAIDDARSFYLPVEGLVTAGEQITSNAPDSEEGTDFSLLVDGDITTFWHSDWHGVTPDDGVHSLEFTLSEPAQLITIQAASRESNLQGAPTIVRIEVSADGESWEDVPGTHIVTTEVETGETDEDGNPITTTEESEEDGWAFTWSEDYYYRGSSVLGGYLQADLGAEYTYVRFLVDETRSNATSNDGVCKYFNLSEVRVIKGEASYLDEVEDMESQYYAVAQEIRDELDKQLEAAEVELADELATQDQIDALQKALDAFNAAVPDPDNVTNALEEAQAQLDAAEEGEGIGYFQEGAKSAFEAAISKIDLTNVKSFSASECKEAIKTINQALADFFKKLNKPEDGVYYRITCQAEEVAVDEDAEDPEAAANEVITGYPHGDYLGVRNANSVNVAWGGEAINENELDDYAGYTWKSIINADGTFSLQNVITGLYLGVKEANNDDTNVILVGEDARAKFDYQSAKVPGVVNIVLAAGIYVNCQPGTNNVVTWSSASGLDNSALSMEEVEEVEVGADWTFELTNKSNLRVMVLPIAVKDVYGQCYTVLGQSSDGTKAYVELKSVGKDGLIEAGVPFVYDPQDFETATFEIVSLDAVTEASTSNGLVGCMNTTIIQTSGNGVLSANKVVKADAGDTVAAGYGFFAGNMPSVAYQSGDLQIESVDGVIDAIETIVSNTTTAKAGIFDIQGRKVSKAVKGLYIINGKKYIVK